MANGLVIADIPGAVNRGLQFRQQQQLAPLQQQQAEGALRNQQQQFETGGLKQQNLKQQIDQRTDEQKNISLVNTALKVKDLGDEEIAPFLTSQISFIRSQGGDPAESERALVLAESGDFAKVREGAENIVNIGVRQGIIKPEAAQTPGAGQFTLGNERFDAQGNLIATGQESPVQQRGSEIEQQKIALRETEQQFREQQAEKKAEQLSPTVQTILNTAQTEAIDAGQRSRSLAVLAGDVSALNIGGGAASTTSETLKGLLGTQDDVSELRRRFNAIRASQSVQNLPPGPASDKDIQLALSGFPKENAGGQQIAAFLRGAAKLENINASFQTFKSDLISESKSTKGLLQKWKTKLPSSVLNRDVLTSELYLTAQEEGLTIEDVKQQLGIQ